MKKGFILGLVFAGLMLGVFVLNNEFVDNDILQTVIEYCFSAPGYLSVFLLKLSDAVAISLIFLYFGLIGSLFAYFCKDRKHKKYLIMGFAIIVVLLHWYFNIKFDQKIAVFFSIN